MTTDKDLPNKDPNAIGFWVDKHPEKKFLEDEKFRSNLQNYLENFLSTKIAITLQKEPTEYIEEYTTGFMIEVIDRKNGQKDMKQAIADFCQNYFKKIFLKRFEFNRIRNCITQS